jgi:hypothetical protein
MKATIDIPPQFEKFLRHNGLNDNEIQMVFVEFMEDFFEQSNTIATELVHWYDNKLWENEPDNT